MRARNIKPGFYKNDKLAECSPWARLIFPGLWMLADREGRLEDRPKRIKGELLPYDSQDVEPLLRELAAHGFIVRYELDGVHYIEIPGFLAHQTPHYSEKASVIKPPNSEKRPTIKEPDSKKPPRKKPASRGGRNPLNPDSLNPDTGILTPDSRTLTAGSAPSPSGTTPYPPPRGKPAAAAPTTETWTAYECAYEGRYGVKPVRNAKVNGQLSQLVQRVGESAPAVAVHYVRSNRGLYVSARHAVDLLLRDAEGLHTAMLTGAHDTDTGARLLDKTQTNLNAFAPLLAEASAMEAGNAK